MTRSIPKPRLAFNRILPSHDLLFSSKIPRKSQFHLVQWAVAANLHTLFFYTAATRARKPPTQHVGLGSSGTLAGYIVVPIFPGFRNRHDLRWTAQHWLFSLSQEENQGRHAKSHGPCTLANPSPGGSATKGNRIAPTVKTMAGSARDTAPRCRGCFETRVGRWNCGRRSRPSGENRHRGMQRRDPEPLGDRLLRS